MFTASHILSGRIAPATIRYAAPTEGAGGAPNPFASAASADADATLLNLVPEAANLVSADGEKPPAAGETPEADSAGEGEGEDADEDEEDSAGEAEEEANGEQKGEEQESEEEEETAEPTVEALTKENEELKAELQNAKTLAPVVVAGSPLAHVTDPAALQQIVADAKAAKEWAFDHLHEGGEVPRELAAALQGVKPEEAKEMTLDPEEARALYKRAEAMLTEHAPQRAQFLQVEKETLDKVRASAPEIFDGKSEQSKAVARMLQNLPQLRTHPHWAAFAADWARGYTARLAEEERNKKAKGAGAKPKPATVKTEGGTRVPLAPKPSTGGARPAAAPKPSAATAKAAERVTSGKASESDYLAVLKVAE